VGTNELSPSHVPASIVPSNVTVQMTITMIERVISQCRAMGRDRIRSMKPDSMSAVDIVDMAIVSVISETSTTG
jgi:hypothetical protein